MAIRKQPVTVISQESLNLLAAAPQLLASLKETLKFIHPYLVDEDGQVDHRGRPWLRVAYEAVVRAEVAK